MAKKTTTKPAKSPIAEPKITAVKATAKKIPAPKKPVTKPQGTPAASRQEISNDDIALRAYFIAEKRQQQGLPGDSAQDWLDAEKQLRAELKKKTSSQKSASFPPASHSMAE